MALGETQEQFARRLRVSTVSIARYETNSIPDAIILERLARVADKAGLRIEGEDLRAQIWGVWITASPEDRQNIAKAAASDLVKATLKDLRVIVKTHLPSEADVSEMRAFILLLAAPGSHRGRLRRALVNGIAEVVRERGSGLTSDEAQQLGAIGREATELAERPAMFGQRKDAPNTSERIHDSDGTDLRSALGEFFEGPELALMCGLAWLFATQDDRRLKVSETIAKNVGLSVLEKHHPDGQLNPAAETLALQVARDLINWTDTPLFAGAVGDVKAYLRKAFSGASSHASNENLAIKSGATGSEAEKRPDETTSGLQQGELVRIIKAVRYGAGLTWRQFAKQLKTSEDVLTGYLVSGGEWPEPGTIARMRVVFDKQLTIQEAKFLDDVASALRQDVAVKQPEQRTH